MRDAVDRSHGRLFKLAGNEIIFLLDINISKTPLVAYSLSKYSENGSGRNSYGGVLIEVLILDFSTDRSYGY